ncbi:sensor histidine kinase [Fulvivirga sediminis]|uniref:histidine kinase n=1 Tax=Fulvivirga sediminis TaxID=2803949 RepID=A0A937K1V3_9BACT|nr:ATP-binding protein [Fulvivirga sediminis]MBL3657102.1 GHKL domain-containing protein [Fulvivirga sediminis]
MEGLITSILKISQLSYKSITKERISVDSMIYDIIDEVSFPYKKFNPKITINTLLNVYGDTILIGQVFSNIISNALKYSSDKENIQILIQAEECDNHTIYEISDNGIGIDGEKINQVFQPFHRLENKGEYEGSGIGLAIVHKIMELHGGKIWVKSERGKGSTFYFSLPNA